MLCGTYNPGSFFRNVNLRAFLVDKYYINIFGLLLPKINTWELQINCKMGIGYANMSGICHWIWLQQQMEKEELSQMHTKVEFRWAPPPPTTFLSSFWRPFFWMLRSRTLILNATSWFRGEKVLPSISAPKRKQRLYWEEGNRKTDGKGRELEQVQWPTIQQVSLAPEQQQAPVKICTQC